MRRKNMQALSNLLILWGIYFRILTKMNSCFWTVSDFHSVCGTAAGICRSFPCVQSGCGMECPRQASVKWFAVSNMGVDFDVCLKCPAEVVTSFILENWKGKLCESGIQIVFFFFFIFRSLGDFPYNRVAHLKEEACADVMIM